MHRREADTVRRALAPAIAFALFATVIALSVSMPAARADDAPDQPQAPGEGEGAVSFAESWGCGTPATLKPFASKKGTLTADEPIRGPAGDFLGRDIGAIWSSLVEWEVPLSGGKVVKVHERALPAFQLVTANIAAAVADGLDYQVKGAGTYNPRTIGGSYRFSFHAFGTAIDINASKNPYRADNVLVTDMPEAFVQAWRDAGFCWGGDWQDAKDPMHFAWMGPASTPGYGDLPEIYPVATAAAPFTQRVFARATPLGAPDGATVLALADGDGDDALDVFRITDHPAGLIVEYARSSSGYAWCGIGRGLAVGTHLDGRDVLFGDTAGNGRMDLWLVGAASGGLTVEIVSRESGFSATTTARPGRALAGTEHFAAGDFDGDGRADLYVFTPGADTTRVDVYAAPDFATQLTTAEMPIAAASSGPWSFSLGDYDLDGALDVFALDRGTATIRIAPEASGFTATAAVPVSVPAAPEDFAVADFDGDGRVDAQYLDAAGRHLAYLGNEPVYASATGWFWPPDFSCSGSPHDGIFLDDDGSDHEPDIDFIALAGVTYGCNPPDNTRYCPQGLVTRGQMAAFFNRMLGLSAATEDWFVDDDSSEFEDDINAIAAAGITFGCDPPANTSFCPDGHVTRGQMAAFVARALGLAGDPADDYFADDGDSVFAGDIDRLAAAGVAFGCTLHDTVHYCPDADMPRDQMATFLARSFALLFGRAP